MREKSQVHIDRRTFVRKAAAGAVAGGLLAGCSRSAEGPAVITHPHVNWRLATSYPPSLDILNGACQRMAERIGELTDGRFRIRVDHALIPGLQVMDAVQQGSVQCGQTASYYYTGKNPSLAFDTTLPFGLTARQQYAWFYHGGGREHMHRVFADFNIISFPCGSTGAQMGGWSRREINTTADLRGLKMRIPGMGGEVMSRLGVTVQVLAGGDVYPALERGVIDAVEWVGPHDDEKLGFHKVAKFYYYPGWWEPGPALSLMINRRAWDDLPSSYQRAVEVATAESAMDMLARYDEQNPAALNRLMAQGIELRRFSDDIMTASMRATEERLEEIASRDAGFRALYESWKKFKKDSFLWFAIAEQSYQHAAFPRT